MTRRGGAEDDRNFRKLALVADERFSLGLAMRNISYRFGFGLIALCVVSQLALWPMTLLGMQLSFGPWFMVLESFGQPIPSMLRPFLPRLLLAALYWGFAALVLRRLWLFARARSMAAPVSYTRIPCWLVATALVCILLFALTLVATIALKAGSGVPAAMLLIPAGLVLSPTIAWVELLSLLPKRRVAVAVDHAD